MILRWTSNKPTKSGWYWVSNNIKEKPLGIYYYKIDQVSLMNYLINSKKGKFFAGPITEPKNNPI